jgi:hypothetical protein
VSLDWISVVKEIRSRRIKWAGHVTRMVEKRYSLKAELKRQVAILGL